MTKSLTTVLRHVIAGFHHVYVILDALDECAERDKLLYFIEDITNWKLGKLHIIATSRPDPVIRDCFEPRASNMINLQGDFLDADIQAYIRGSIGCDVQLCKWPKEIRGEMVTILMEGANGMYAIFLGFNIRIVIFLAGFVGFSVSWRCFASVERPIC